MRRDNLHSMTSEILALLIGERDKLNNAIAALTEPTKRRGRPPKNAQAALAPDAATSTPAPKKKARKFSAAQRKAQSEKLKAFWAAKRAAGEPKPAKGKKAAKTSE